MKKRKIEWPTAAVLIVTIASLAAVLILAHGDVQEALLAILGTLGTVLAAALPRLIATKGES